MSPARAGHPRGKLRTRRFARKGSVGTLQRMEVVGKNPSGPRPGGRSAVGIMLADPGHRPSTEAERRRLADAVAQRGWSLSLRTGMATALADLCLAEREEQARESWGLPPRHDLVLLIVGGFAEADLQVLSRALRDHAPRTAAYRWDGYRIVPVGSGDPPPDATPDDADPRRRGRRPGTLGHPGVDPIDGGAAGRESRGGRRAGAVVGARPPFEDAGAASPRGAPAPTGDARTQLAGNQESRAHAAGCPARIAP